VIAFLDASALIYLLEGTAAPAARARAALAEVERADPDTAVALSRLSWLECRVGPMKADDAAVLSTYDTFFARPDLVWVELTRNVVELAAVIRARHGLRTPDALQAASCLQCGTAHRLLTGDAAFRRVAGLNVVLVRG
jgi:predicted nucleic acid-binding protein